MLLATAACALLSFAEISAVQGERPVRTKPSTSDLSGLAVERCFFELPTFPKDAPVAGEPPERRPAGPRGDGGNGHPRAMVRAGIAHDTTPPYLHAL
jgi:hypothetical protein